MGRRLTLLIIGLVTLLAVSGVISAQSGEEGQPGVLRNPLNAYAGADPWLTYYEGKLGLGVLYAGKIEQGCMLPFLLPKAIY